VPAAPNDSDATEMPPSLPIARSVVIESDIPHPALSALQLSRRIRGLFHESAPAMIDGPWWRPTAKFFLVAIFKFFKEFPLDVHDQSRRYPQQACG
jgi:hypothetical protein